MSLLTHSFFIQYLAFSGLIVHLSNQIALRGEKVRDAGEREFPSVVSIGKKKNNYKNTHLCTGTLITSQHVLTAEHCLENENPADIQITVGSINRRHGTKYRASHWITYDEWNNSPEYRNQSALHDIAIITLNSTVQNAQTAKLSKRPSVELYGSDIKVAGWGITNNNKKPVVLKTALSTVMSTDECNDYIDELTNHKLTIHENSLCSRTEPWLLTGSGDSGGPSFDKNNKLVGVTVGRCPHEDFLIRQPEVLEQTQIVLHMDIKYYKDFIHSVTQSKLRIASRAAKKLFTKNMSYCGFKKL